ncbi:DUF3307 domain-containing protein [Parafilimonas sp.]|uniref:DUF3307 domain-containing protein n=1 Tax=Parafilimonas sp. TaxID=1969739 RepID=UPI0039E35F64
MITNEALTWLVRLVLAHLLSDFILQPKSWVAHRARYHYRSVKLYLHIAVTTITAALLTGLQHARVLPVIAVTHWAIDGWKSYKPATAKYFIADQLLHLLVIAACWCSCYPGVLLSLWQHLPDIGLHGWVLITAFVFVTAPAGILIGQLTHSWREKVEDPDHNLANAGKWIGIAERVIVLVLVLYSQFSAIGLLVAAKGIIRFQEKDRQEVKTEYLVIGTLLSIAIAIITGVLVKLSLHI